MTKRKRVVHTMSVVPRRRRLPGVTLPAALVFLACASYTGAQPAVGSDAETASAGPCSPPAEQTRGAGIVGGRSVRPTAFPIHPEVPDRCPNREVR